MNLLPFLLGPSEGERMVLYVPSELSNGQEDFFRKRDEPDCD